MPKAWQSPSPEVHGPDGFPPRSNARRTRLAIVGRLDKMELVIGEQLGDPVGTAVSPASEWYGVVNMFDTIRILWAFAQLRRAARSAPV